MIEASVSLLQRSQLTINTFLLNVEGIEQRGAEVEAYLSAPTIDRWGYAQVTHRAVVVVILYSGRCAEHWRLWCHLQRHLVYPVFRMIAAQE